MSRLCKLRSKSYGSLGQWAYNEIKSLKEQLESTKAKLIESELHAARLVGALSEYARKEECEGFYESEAHKALSTPINLDALNELQENAARYLWINENCTLGIKQNGTGWSLNTRQCAAPDCMKELASTIDAAMEASNG